MSLISLFLLLGHFVVYVLSIRRSHPILKFELKGENTAVSGVHPWFQQHVYNPQQCLLLCLKKPSECKYVEYEPLPSNPTQWLCKLFGAIADLSSYLVFKTNSLFYRAVLENRDCLDWKNLGYTKDGYYYIQPVRERRQVFCDMTTDGGGWTVIQRRLDGSENFNRNWEDYKQGFGNAEGEYWIGNDFIHELTKDTENNTLVRLDTHSFDNVHDYTVHQGFYIENEANKYRLHTGVSMGIYSSVEIVNDWNHHDGKYFTTKDYDNDVYSGNCASELGSGWWFLSCFSVNMNGKYHDNGICQYGHGISWLSREHTKSMKFASISIKRKQ